MATLAWLNGHRQLRRPLRLPALRGHDRTSRRGDLLDGRSRRPARERALGHTRGGVPMRLPDRLTGLAMAALGVLAAYGGSRLPPIPGQEVGPSAFPILIGVGLIVSGMLIALGIGHRFEEEAEA